jgi:hypothetical protein
MQGGRKIAIFGAKLKPFRGTRQANHPPSTEQDRVSTKCRYCARARLFANFVAIRHISRICGKTVNFRGKRDGDRAVPPVITPEKTKFTRELVPLAFRRNGSISRKAQQFVDNRKIAEMQGRRPFPAVAQNPNLSAEPDKEAIRLPWNKMYDSHQMSTLCPSPPFRKLWRSPPHLENLRDIDAFPRNKGMVTRTEVKTAAFRGKRTNFPRKLEFRGSFALWEKSRLKQWLSAEPACVHVVSPRKAGWGQGGAEPKI